MGVHAADPDFVEDAADAAQNQDATNADARTDTEREADENSDAAVKSTDTRNQFDV